MPRVRGPRPEMTVLACFALEEEAAPFRTIAAGRPTVSILVSGVGRTNVERSLGGLLAGGAPAVVLTCGFAGGLNPGLELGAVIFELPEGKGSAEPPAPIAEPKAGGSQASRLREKLLAAGARPGRFFCADRIATTAAEKHELRARTAADAVEMESGTIHAACRERGIPCVTIRVISDTADEDLPLDFNRLSKPDQSLDYWKLAWAIVKAPGSLPALRQLQQKTRFAAERLAAVLARVV
jgi:adenosylhomocysteine nucleosidase